MCLTVICLSSGWAALRSSKEKQMVCWGGESAETPHAPANVFGWLDPDPTPELILRHKHEPLHGVYTVSDRSVYCQ